MKKTTKYSVALVGTTLLSNPSVATSALENASLEVLSATTQDSFLSKIPADLRVATRSFKSVRGSGGNNSSIVTSGSAGNKDVSASGGSVQVFMNQLSFAGLQEHYAVGEVVRAAVAISVPLERSARELVDLWVAISIPELPDKLLFFTGSVRKPTFSMEPQAFLTGLETMSSTHQVLEFPIPPGIGGAYTFYALLVAKGKSPLENGSYQDLYNRSNVISYSVVLDD